MVFSGSKYYRFSTILFPLKVVLELLLLTQVNDELGNLIMAGVENKWNVDLKHITK